VLELNLADNALGINLGKTSQARIVINKPVLVDQKMDIVIYLGSTGTDEFCHNIE
jgi:hypothetical protein